MDSTEIGRLVVPVPRRARGGGHRRGQVQAWRWCRWQAKAAAVPRATRRRPSSASRRRIGPVTVAWYALAAQRHMYEFGTTSEQLAGDQSGRLAARPVQPATPSLKKVVSVEDVRQLAAGRRPAAPAGLCVVTDGGGAVVLVSPGGRARPAATQGQDPGPRRSAEAHQQRPHRPDLHRRALVRTARVRRGRRDASRTSTTPRSTTRSPSPCSRRSKTLASARRARAASSSSDGALLVAGRQAAVQHRRRRTVQQPSRPIAAA